MKKSTIQSLADATANMLLSHACHGMATSSLEGCGEITLRDGLVVAAASVGARTKQAWILEREVLPQGWSEANVDLMVYRKGQGDSTYAIGGVELKWWRQTDKPNASNRRRDLIKDFVRAAALYSKVESFAFVALLSTAGAWDSTTSTNGSDKGAMSMLSMDGTQKWNLSGMATSSGVKAALKSLNSHVPIANIFHSELLSDCSIDLSSKVSAFARVWSIKKPQKTKFLTEDEVRTLTL
jgi:hypothetical protein